MAKGFTPFVDVSTSTVTTDKADSLNGRMVTDSIYNWDASVHNGENTIRKSCSLAKLSNDHSCTRVAF